MTPPVDIATETYRQGMMHSELVLDVLSGLILTGIGALIVFGRKILQLPKKVDILNAVAIRQLKSNARQNKAIRAIAECQKAGKCNGATDEALKAMDSEESGINDFLKSVAMGKIPKEDADA